MQERASLRGRIERQSTERRSDADTPIRILGAALCAFGQPTASALGQRAMSIPLTLRVLRKVHRSRTVRTRQTIPTE